MFEELLEIAQLRETQRRIVITNTKEWNREATYVREGEFVKTDLFGDMLLVSAHALAQLAKLLNATLTRHTIIPGIVFKNPPEYAQKNIPDWINAYLDLLQDKEKTFKLNVHNQQYVSAIFTDSYVDVTNVEIIETLADAVNAQQINIAAIEYDFISDFNDMMILNVFTEQFSQLDAGGSVYGVGLRIINSSNGKSSLSIMPIVKASICDNSISFRPSLNDSYRHTGNVIAFWHDSLKALAPKIQLALDLYNLHIMSAEVLADEIDLFQRAISDLNLPARAEHIMINGISSELQDGFSAEGTLFGAICGMTMYAKVQDNPEREIEVIMYAGEVLKREMAKINTTQ